MFRPEDFGSIDPAEYVTREQGRFFRAGVFNAEEAASQIVLAAMLGGASEAVLRRHGDWLVITADTDWLEEAGDGAFTDLGSSRGGPNGFSMEYVVTVLADSVVTATPGALRVLKGTPTGLPDLATLTTGRAVAFLA